MPPLIDVNKAFKVAVENGNKVIEIDLGQHEVEDRIAKIAVNQLQVAAFVTPSAEAEEPIKPKTTRRKGAKNASVSNEGAGQA